MDVIKTKIPWLSSLFHIKQSPRIHKKDPPYKHCKKYDHDESGCFELIDYPSRWSVRGGGAGQSEGCRGRGIG